MDSSRSHHSNQDLSFSSSVLLKSEQDKKDKHLFFHKYDRMRIKEIFDYNPDTKMQNRAVTDEGLDKIKEKVVSTLLNIRSGCEDLDEEALKAIEKQKKFCNFILHLHEKTTLRRWKEQVFGIGADPRLALMMIEERDKIRDEFYKPVLEHRKSLKLMRFKL